MTFDSAVTAKAGTRPAAPGAGAAVTTGQVAARTIRKYMRSPQLLMATMVGSAVFLLLFRYIFGGAIRLGTVPYVDFLIPGMVATSMLITGTGAAVGVAEDADQGLVDRLRSLPVPRIALLTGRVLGDLAIVAWATAVTVALGFAVGFRLHGGAGEALLAFALCVVCGFAFLWMYMCLGLVSPNAQAAQSTSMFVYPVIFVSSAYVPVGTLPGWMRPVAEHQPVTAIANAVRSLALGDPAMAGLDHTAGYWVLVSLAWSAGIAAVFAPLAVALYRRS
ncbi:ABC transporter permease [Actinomadura madurae]|uniref:ABC transporter permease n=1 Tax=Actinomadura madurae TaxID=1993 RepID=UPI000D80D68B|nr:ABC transporter permease [Actinomadura madurae]SPT63344.1 Daunorubicin/doxorubicin resistance ABC transporter permease protein drrB [Actinomadura madurae]